MPRPSLKEILSKRKPEAEYLLKSGKSDFKTLVLSGGSLSYRKGDGGHEFEEIERKLTEAKQGELVFLDSRTDHFGGLPPIILVARQQAEEVQLIAVDISDAVRIDPHASVNKKFFREFFSDLFDNFSRKQEFHGELPEILVNPNIKYKFELQFVADGFERTEVLEVSQGETLESVLMRLDGVEYKLTPLGKRFIGFFGLEENEKGYGWQGYVNGALMMAKIGEDWIFAAPGEVYANSDAKFVFKFEKAMGDASPEVYATNAGYRARLCCPKVERKENNGKTVVLLPTSQWFGAVPGSPPQPIVWSDGLWSLPLLQTAWVGMQLQLLPLYLESSRKAADEFYASKKSRKEMLGVLLYEAPKASFSKPQEEHGKERTDFFRHDVRAGGIFQEPGAFPDYPPKEEKHDGNSGSYGKDPSKDDRKIGSEHDKPDNDSSRGFPAGRRPRNAGRGNATWNAQSHGTGPSASSLAGKAPAAKEGQMPVKASQDWKPEAPSAGKFKPILPKAHQVPLKLSPKAPFKPVPLSSVKNLKAVIFDLDGVVVDSERAHLATFNAVLRQFGVKISPAIWKRNYTGVGSVAIMQDVAARNGIKADVGKLVEKRAEIYHDYVEKHGLPVMPGFREFFAELQGCGVQSAIASGGHRPHVLASMMSIGIPRIPFVGLEDVERRKPAPDVFLLAAEKLGVKPSECIVFEDSLSGLQAAAAAGMPCIALATTLPKKELEGKAARIIANFRSRPLRNALAQLITKRKGAPRPPPAPPSRSRKSSSSRPAGRAARRRRRARRKA